MPTAAVPDPAAKPVRVRRHAVRCLLLTALACLSGCLAPRPRLAVVATASGPIAGVRLRDGRAFRGVPYAAPPVGPRRWREPEPMPAWDGVLAVDHQAARRDPEDCLRVDVFAGPEGGPARPMLVWLDDGADSPQKLDGSRLATAGLVVAIVHARRGALAVFAHPALERQRPGGPINFGLLDRIAALRWLQQHAETFGADGSRVAIAGSGAGATAALYLLGCADARGLFQRAILHDPRAFVVPATRSEAIAGGQRLLASNGLLPATTADDLRALSADRLLAVALEGPLSMPVDDGQTVQGAPWRAFQRDDRTPIGLMVGSTGAATADGDLLTAATARWCAAANSARAATFLYLIRARPNQSLPRRDDLATMLFGPRDPSAGGPTGARDRWLQQIVRDSSVAFVQDGVPAARSVPAWPPYTPDTDITFLFDDVVRAEGELLREPLDRATSALLPPQTPP